MCDFILADSVPTETATVTLHPRMVRLDLSIANGDGELPVAHINLTPAQALILTYQLNEARTAALQPTPEATS